MPPELDEIKDMDPPSSERADLDAPADTGEQAPAASSAATDAEQKDTLAVVRDVVATRPEPDATGSSPEGETKTDTPEPEPDPEPKQPDDADYSDVPFNKHPRFQHLLRKSRAFEADAQRYRSVETFLSENGLTGGEAAEALKIRALMKVDPVAAWEALRPFAQQVATAAGAILPPEIRQRVDAGELSLAAARELSAAQAGLKATETQREWERQRAAERQEAERRESLTDAATSWEQERRLRDPNFAEKENALHREVAYLQATEGRPTDAAGVLDQCNRAYKAVNAALRPTPVPPAHAETRKPAVRPIVGGQVTAQPQQPAAASTLDVIQREIAKRG